MWLWKLSALRQRLNSIQDNADIYYNHEGNSFIDVPSHKFCSAYKSSFALRFAQLLTSGEMFSKNTSHSNFAIPSVRNDRFNLARDSQNVLDNLTSSLPDMIYDFISVDIQEIRYSGSRSSQKVLILRIWIMLNNYWRKCLKKIVRHHNFVARSCRIPT